MANLAMAHGRGEFGLPVNQAKFIELPRQSAGLGYPPVLYQIGNFHGGHHGGMGLEQNEEEALKYWEKAVEGGDILAGHNLACKEYKNGNVVAGMRRFRLSASGGFRISMESLIICFEKGFLHHADLAETLQAFYRARAEMKSNDRDEYIEHLKKTGEYEAEYEC